jgi:hypothetical protein
MDPDSPLPSEPGAPGELLPQEESKKARSTNKNTHPTERILLILSSLYTTLKK